MSTSVTSVTSHFPSAENGFATTTASSTLSGATVVELNSIAGYVDGEVVVFTIEPTNPTAKQTFTGIVDTALVRITDVVWTSGSNQLHQAGVQVVDYPAAAHVSMISKGLLIEHNQNGTHSDITADSLDTDTLTVNTSMTIPASSIDTTELADGAVTAAKMDAQEDWIAPSFQNSWVNYGSDHATAGYMKDSMGFVHLKGLVKSGTSGTIFTLPAGYRPVDRELYAVLSNGAIGRIDIYGSTGTVTAVSPYSTTWVSLSGITFKAG